jgi:hypothetical protein
LPFLGAAAFFVVVFFFADFTLGDLAAFFTIVARK